MHQQGNLLKCYFYLRLQVKLACNKKSGSCKGPDFLFYNFYTINPTS